MSLNENIARERDERIADMVRTPTFLVVAGSLPGLAVATSLENGLAIGIVNAVVILSMALLAPALRSFTGTWSRTAVMLMTSVTVAVLLGFAVRVIDPVVHESLGMYVPLAAVNALAAAWMVGEGLVVAPAKSPLGTAALAALSVLCALTVVGFVNGMFTTGRVFGLTMAELASSPISVFGKPAGSLLVLALIAVFTQSIEQVLSARTHGEGEGSEGGER